MTSSPLRLKIDAVDARRPSDTPRPEPVTSAATAYSHQRPRLPDASCARSSPAGIPKTGRPCVICCPNRQDLGATSSGTAHQLPELPPEADRSSAEIKALRMRDAFLEYLDDWLHVPDRELGDYSEQMKKEWIRRRPDIDPEPRLKPQLGGTSTES